MASICWPFFIYPFIMKYALITGASKGIGKSIALELAQKGIPVLLVARNEALLNELRHQIIEQYKVDAQILAVDLSQVGASLRVFDWVTQNGYVVHMLINNAGYGLSGQFIDYSEEEYAGMMQVNMQVPVELTRIFLPSLLQLPKAYILNIASSAAYQAVPGLTVYAATKSFIVQFSRGLAYELRKSPVSVTVVSPGGTATDFANRAKVGNKAVKAGERLNMTPEQVAKQAVDAMLKGKTEQITGFVNQLGAALAWLMPRKLSESVAADLYEVK